jgi:hypothetical protein
MRRDGNGGQMRSEDDLRQALATLERHAPSAGTVLAAVRHASGPARPGRFSWLRPQRGSPWWRRPRLALALALAAAAVAAGLVITLLPGSASPRTVSVPVQTELPRLAPGQAGLPSAVSVGQAMLTAFRGVRDDIEYTMQTGGVTRGVATSAYRTWSWPARPAPGQQQVDRTVFAERTPQAPDLTVIEDNAVGYTTPRAGVQTVRGQVTTVCYAGTGQTGCAWDTRQTPPGTWSQVRQRVWASASDISAAGGLSPADLARGIAKGYWRVVGRTRLEGQPAIELSETGRGPDLWGPLPTLLWVNARTHLPIRMVNGVGHAQWDVNEWAFLPPTAANLARLRVRIPPGYPRSVPSR